MSANHPVNKNADDNDKQDRTGIVHVLSGDWQHRRERHPDDDEEEVCQGEEINRDAPATELEGTIGQRVARRSSLA